MDPNFLADPLSWSGGSAYWETAAGAQMDGRQNYAWVHGPKRSRKQKQQKLYSCCRSSTTSSSIVVVVMVAPRLVFGGRGESSLLIYVFGESCQEQKERQRGPRILFQHFNNTQQPPRKSTGQLLVPHSWMLLRDYTRAECWEPTWRLRGQDREILSWNVLRLWASWMRVV